MDRNTVEEFLASISKPFMDLGLHRIVKLLEYMDNPQDKLKFIHVAGTNGKGSTCAMIVSILKQAGYKTGKFASPHLEEFNERITVDEERISYEDIERIGKGISQKIALMQEEGLEMPTKFEVITAIAIQYYYEKKCDIVVLEVGLGGRFDSTNVVQKPLVSVITSISHDHLDRLGNTLEKIAFEKAGIIKNHCPTAVSVQPDNAMNVIKKVANEMNSELICVNENAIVFKGNKEGLETFDFEEYKALEISLLGLHQVQNAACAIKVIEVLRRQGYRIPNQSIYDGLKKAFNMGRFEKIGTNPEFLIDGAHNVSGMKALRDGLERYYKGKQIILVMGVLTTKEYLKMVELIAPIADICIASEPLNPCALKADRLAKCFLSFGKNAVVEEGVEQAVELALQQAKGDSVVCCCGSLYFIGAVRSHLFRRSLTK